MSNDRSSLYKNAGRDSSTMRKGRSELTVNIRKEKREETFAKRRNLLPEDEVTDDDPGELPHAGRVGSTSPNVYTKQEVEELVSKAQSSNYAEKLQATTRIRKTLSMNNPPIDELISAGVIPVLVQAINDKTTEMQFEASWALTNISSGTPEQTRMVVEAGPVPRFIELLGSPNEQVVEQSVWALGNIIGDCSYFRDYCLSLGVLAPLIKIIQPDINFGVLRNVAWVLVNLCRSKEPAPAPHVVATLLPVLTNLISYPDISVMIDTIWAFSYITDGAAEYIQSVIDSGAVPALVDRLNHGSDKVVTAALRAVGNIVTGNDEQTQRILDAGVLAKIPPLLLHQKGRINKEAIWLLSNITAGTVEQIQQVIDANLIEPIIQLLVEGEFAIRKEAVWAITNITVGGSSEQAMHLVKHGVITPFCDILNVNDIQMIEVVLDGIHHLLQKAGDQLDRVSEEIEECGGLDKIERLQNHENEQVYKLAFKIIEDLFNAEDDAPINEGQDFVFESTQQNVPTEGFSFNN